jgi:hypothetical protein
MFCFHVYFVVKFTLFDLFDTVDFSVHGCLFLFGNATIDRNPGKNV